MLVRLHREPVLVEPGGRLHQASTWLPVEPCAVLMERGIPSLRRAMKGALQFTCPGQSSQQWSNTGQTRLYTVDVEEEVVAIGAADHLAREVGADAVAACV
jgi:hypothetical protein